MEKIKDFIKEIRSNKRKKALFSLALWLIFIFVITRMIGKPPENITISDNKTNNVNNLKSGKENYNNSKSFEFEYIINYSINKKNYNYNIVGTYYENNNYFDFNNKKYYLKDDILYLVDEDKKTRKVINKNIRSKYFGVIEIEMLLKKGLYTILDSSVEESKTTYKDGATKITYNYITSDNKKIIINTSEDNGLINSISLDLKNYYLDKKFDSYNVICNLKNINNIAEYNKNYDTYKIEGE